LSIGSNHLVTIVADALSLLGDAGVETPSRLLAPLVSASLDNALRLGDGALTGPVSRGDVATVVTHLRTLAERAPQVLPAYRAMALRTAERARDSDRITAAQFADLADTLERG
jgi:predicted short-subunit dehydrogenase-like oxidoreductase (DUF2520 family)